MKGVDVASPATCHPERKCYARGMCKACYTTAWRAANPEKVRRWRRDWRAANPEKVRQSARAWYTKNRRKVCQQRRAWSMRNPVKAADQLATLIERLEESPRRYDWRDPFKEIQ